MEGGRVECARTFFRGTFLHEKKGFWGLNFCDFSKYKMLFLVFLGALEGAGTFNPPDLGLINLIPPIVDDKSQKLQNRILHFA